MLSEEGIIDTVGDLVFISNSLVYLGHVSIGEYLTRGLRCWPENPDLSFLRSTPDEMHSLLTTSCINYLRVVEQNSLMQLSTGRDTDISTRYPFFSYSLFRVAFHFFESKGNMPTEEMNKFVQSTTFGFYLDYWYHMAPECLEKRCFSNRAFPEIFRLALWYDSVRTSQDGFIRVLQDELKRREATLGSRNHKSAALENFLELWELQRLGDLYSEVSGRNHAVDEILPVTDHRSPPNNSIFRGLPAWFPLLILIMVFYIFNDRGSLRRFCHIALGRCKKAGNADQEKKAIEQFQNDQFLFYLSMAAVYAHWRYQFMDKQLLQATPTKNSARVTWSASRTLIPFK